MKLKDRVAIITGATGALGKIVTETFLTSGAKVTAVSTHEANLNELQNQLAVVKENFLGVPVDLMQEASVNQLVQQTIDRFRRIDILLNLVGGYAGGVEVAETSEEEWDRMINLNLKTAFLVSKAVLPRMYQQGYGRIINISSRGAVEVGPRAAAYSVSKAGVITLTQAIAAEVKGKGITANVVLPGMIDTAGNRKAMPKAEFFKWVKPESIAKLLVFIASDDAKEMNGAAIPFYGIS